MKYITLALVSVIAAIFCGCSGSDESADLDFAKGTFESLTRGDTSVIQDIDWETLTSLGIPVGPSYISIISPEEKATFKKGFVTQFATTFRDVGGSVTDFSNWRITRIDRNFTEVTADSVKGSLQLTVSERDSQKRLSALKIVNRKD